MNVEGPPRDGHIDVRTIRTAPGSDYNLISDLFEFHPTLIRKAVQG